MLKNIDISKIDRDDLFLVKGFLLENVQEARLSNYYGKLSRFLIIMKKLFV